MTTPDITYGDVDWKSAACRNQDVDAFFPDKDEAQLTATEMWCKLCLIRADCLRWALQVPEAYGVWGGLTEKQRKALLSKRLRVRCPSCLGRDIIKNAFDERVEVCRACGLSWAI